MTPKERHELADQASREWDRALELTNIPTVVGMVDYLLAHPSTYPNYFRWYSLFKMGVIS